MKRAQALNPLLNHSPKSSRAGHYEVKLEGDFSARHFLRGYDQGRDEPIHDHHWKVQLEIHTMSLNEAGISVDFVAVREMLAGELQAWHGHTLNDLPEFQQKNPSAEEVAKCLYTRLDSRVNKIGGKLVRVTVWETRVAAASYVRDSR